MSGLCSCVSYYLFKCEGHWPIDCTSDISMVAFRVLWLVCTTIMTENLNFSYILIAIFNQKTYMNIMASLLTTIWKHLVQVNKLLERDKCHIPQRYQQAALPLVDLFPCPLVQQIDAGVGVSVLYVGKTRHLSIWVIRHLSTIKIMIETINIHNMLSTKENFHTCIWYMCIYELCRCTIWVNNF